MVNPAPRLDPLEADGFLVGRGKIWYNQKNLSGSEKNGC